MTGKASDTDDERGFAHIEHSYPQAVRAGWVDDQPEPVTCRTVVRLIRGQRYLPVVTEFHYDGADPYSVCVIFNAHTDMTVEWTFGRELLLSGQRGLSGAGDVQIWPSEIHGSGVVFISLRSGAEMDVVAAPAKVIDAFLERTLELVPLGEEERHLGIDSPVSQLLDEI
ncbi:SsgA family sporulation/cell division regulator [Streptomyces sp. KR55]|uniref:SsgA family sporulation/cell division regulator n=1 Tax=Streptomyces sp. KR55 TaxID=3457425 RepID=UPI003FD0564E